MRLCGRIGFETILKVKSTPLENGSLPKGEVVPLMLQCLSPLSRY